MFKHKKKFGQNFLKDKNVLKKIVHIAQVEDKNVIEIGAGKGSLTKLLGNKCKFVESFEIDKTLKIYLDKVEQDSENIKIIYKNFLKSNISDRENFCVVGNIPYNITSPILFKLIEQKNIISITLTIQKEFADRLTAKVNSKSYNALSIIFQEHYLIERHLEIKRTFFTPTPKIDSTTIRMVPRNKINKEYIKFLKICFENRRKTLINNLKNRGYDKNELETVLSDLSLNKKIRAQEISIEKFKTLYRKLLNLKKLKST